MTKDHNSESEIISVKKLIGRILPNYKDSFNLKRLVSNFEGALY